MSRAPAKVLEPGDLCRVLKHVKKQRHPNRNTAIILLSFKAGLRACEIAGLEWSMVLKSDYTLSDVIYISKAIAKRGSQRHIPTNHQLQTALTRLHKELGRPRAGPVITSERGGHMTAGSIVNYFSRLYATLELTGCSSHSGRRTFITNAAKALSRSGGSLRDVQELAGHKALTTTERYIQGDRDAQRKLVSMI